MNQDEQEIQTTVTEDASGNGAMMTGQEPKKEKKQKKHQGYSRHFF